MWCQLQLTLNMAATFMLDFLSVFYQQIDICFQYIYDLRYVFDFIFLQSNNVILSLLLSKCQKAQRRINKIKFPMCNICLLFTFSNDNNFIFFHFAKLEPKWFSFVISSPNQDIPGLPLPLLDTGMFAVSNIH